MLTLLALSDLVFAISDIVWQAIVGAVVTVILAIIQVWGQHRMKETIEKTGKDAAIKVAEVKSTLQVTTEKQAEKLEDIARKGDENILIGKANHVLLNSNMAAQLKISAVALRRIADLTKGSGDDEAAILAEKLLEEHDAKQSELDTKVSQADQGKMRTADPHWRPSV